MRKKLWSERIHSSCAIRRCRVEQLIRNFNGQFFTAQAPTKTKWSRIWNCKATNDNGFMSCDFPYMRVYDAGNVHGYRTLNLENIKWIEHGGVHYVVV